MVGDLGIPHMIPVSASGLKGNFDFPLLRFRRVRVKQVRQVRTQLTIEGAIAAQQPGDCPSGIQFIAASPFEVFRTAPSPMVLLHISIEQCPRQRQV